MSVARVLSGAGAGAVSASLAAGGLSTLFGYGAFGLCLALTAVIAVVLIAPCSFVTLRRLEFAPVHVAAYFPEKGL